MAANGISTLSSKEAKQLAKLELAQTKRRAGGNVNSPAYRTLNTYDIELLPTRYVDNAVVDNTNVGGLQSGRPWT